MTNYVWHTWRVGWKKTKIDVRIRTRIITVTDSYLIIVVSSREIHCWWGLGTEGRCVFRALDPRRHNSLTFIKRSEWEKYKLLLIIEASYKCTFRSILSSTIILRCYFPRETSGAIVCGVFLLSTYLCNILVLSTSNGLLKCTAHASVI